MYNYSDYTIRLLANLINHRDDGSKQKNKEEKVIRTVKAFFFTLVLYVLLILILYFLFNQKIILPASQSQEVKITLNIENFESSPPTQEVSAIERDQQALEDATKKLFEKISTATEPVIHEPITPESERHKITKEIFEKIIFEKESKPSSKPSSKIESEKESETVSLQSTTEEAIEKARLAKVEQKRLDIQKKEQEALAKEKALAEEKSRFEKIETARLNALAFTVAKEKARLADIEQERLKEEKKKQEALAKVKRIKKEKQAKIKKQELAKAKAKEKAQKEKLRKQKLAKKKRAKRAKKKKPIKQKQAKRRSNDPLANAIMSASTSLSPRKSKRPAMRMIKQFYGSEFNSFTKTQKRFIEENLGSIYQITQRTLTRNGYPWVAQKTRQQGTAIVTFYLHPNGNISGLRLKKRIGYAALDKNTLKVIRIAYKDYPRPKTKTKITFYVEYSLF